MVEEEEMVGIQLSDGQVTEMEAEAEEAVSCQSDSSVDADGDNALDNVETRIQHSLERIQQVFGKKGLWFDKLDIPLSNGVWLPDVMADLEGQPRSVQGGERPTLLDSRYVAQVLRGAQSRTLEIISRLSGVYHPQQLMEKKASALEMLYKGEEYAMQEELSSLNQLVYLKVCCLDQFVPLLS